MTTLNLSNDNSPTATTPEATVPDASATESNENNSPATVVPTDAEARGEDEKPSANSEAARYRTQLRAAETALEAANEKIAAYQRSDVLRAASDLAQPVDLLEVGGHDLAAFITEEGAIDAEAVASAVAALLQTRPGLAKNYRRPGSPTHPNFGQGAPATSGKGRPTTWDKFLNPYRQ